MVNNWHHQPNSKTGCSRHFFREDAADMELVVVAEKPTSGLRILLHLGGSSTSIVW